MPQLDVSTYLAQILWFVCCFPLLLLFMQFVFFPGMEKIVNQRNNVVKENLATARVTLAKTESVQSSNQTILQQVMDEARAMNMVAEKEIKDMLERNTVAAENSALIFLKQQLKEFDDWYDDQLQHSTKEIIQNIKSDVILALQKPPMISNKKRYDS